MSQTHRLSPAQAQAYLGVSRFIFDKKFRPQLTEYRISERIVRFDRIELDALLTETAVSQQESGDSMFNRRTVQDALDHAWRIKWKHAKGARKKAQLMKVVGAEMGTKRLAGFGYNEVEEWIAELRDRDLAIATIKSRISCLYFALDLAVKKGWLKAMPPSPEIGTANSKLRWLTEAEAKRLREACDCQRHQVADVMQDAITFLLGTGARVGELLKVREDSLTERGSMTYVEFLDRKAGDDLRVPLTTAARDAIYQLLANKYWQARVRGTRESAKRHNSAQNWLTHRFEEIRDHAGLPGVTAHTLRHTYASWLVQRGIDLYRVQKLLGHSSIKMTERYSHLAPSSLDTAITVLEPGDPKVAKLEDYRRGR